MNKAVEKAEPDTLSGVYDDLLEGLEEALEWAKGERELRTVVRSTDDKFYTATPADKTLKGHTAAPKLPVKAGSDV